MRLIEMSKRYKDFTKKRNEESTFRHILRYVVRSPRAGGGGGGVKGSTRNTLHNPRRRLGEVVNLLGEKA